MATSTTAPATGQLGERRLKTIHAVAQALAIGPMFSVALVLGGVSNPSGGAGFNAALSVLVAGLGVLCIGYAYSLFARRYAGAGAVYEYLTHGAHPNLGILAAGFFFLGTLFLGGGGIYLGLGILANGFWVAHISSSAPSWWVFLLAFLVLALIVNYLGIRIAIGIMLTFAALSVLPMLYLAITIIAKGGQGGNTFAVFNPSTTSISTAFNGVLLGILLFVGFEAAASIGEESHDPHRSIPRAVIGTVAASAVFFVLMAYAISIGYGKTAVSQGAWAGAPSALDAMATQYVGSWLATIIDLVVILDATALALAICVTIGRGYFALARDGLLPKVFAKTSRHHTPWVGNLMVVVGGVGLLIVTKVAGYQSHFLAPLGPKGQMVPIFPSDQFATFIVSATAGSFVIEFVYLILAVVALRLVWQMNGQPGQWWRYPVVLIAIATPILGFKGALWPQPHNGSNYNWEALYWGLAVIVLSLIWFVVVRVTRPDKVRNAAMHAAEGASVAGLDEPFQPSAAS